MVEVNDMQNKRMDRIEDEVGSLSKDLQQHLIDCAKSHTKNFWSIVIVGAILVIMLGPDTTVGQTLLKLVPFIGG